MRCRSPKERGPRKQIVATVTATAAIAVFPASKPPNARQWEGRGGEDGNNQDLKEHTRSRTPSHFPRTPTTNNRTPPPPLPPTRLPTLRILPPFFCRRPIYLVSRFAVQRGADHGLDEAGGRSEPGQRGSASGGSASGSCCGGREGTGPYGRTGIGDQGNGKVCLACLACVYIYIHMYYIYVFFCLRVGMKPGWVWRR